MKKKQNNEHTLQEEEEVQLNEDDDDEEDEDTNEAEKEFYSKHTRNHKQVPTWAQCEYRLIKLTKNNKLYV